MTQKMVCSPDCENVIAFEVEIEGRVLLQIGGLLVSKVDGVCIQCGKEFHWSVTEKLLEKILKSCQNH